MKRLLLAAIVAMAASGPAWAQSSGTGVGVATSTSSSQAISGQGGTGVGVAAITTNSTVPADQTVRNVPGIVAPGLAAAGLETCLGSVSGGGAFVGTGFSFGTTIPDPGCAARLDARTLWSMGLKKAAVARLCLNGDIYRAMPEVCDQVPAAARAGLSRPAAGPHPLRAGGSLRGAALHRRRHLAGGRGNRQEPSLQRLRCDPAELPCLGSRRSPFDAEEEGDGEW